MLSIVGLITESKLNDWPTLVPIPAKVMVLTFNKASDVVNTLKVCSIIIMPKSGVLWYRGERVNTIKVRPTTELSQKVAI
jgi:hypothetical protein